MANYETPWSKLVTHPYLVRKKIDAYEGVKVDGEKLLIPMSTGWNQEIFSDGRKHYPHGSKKGHYIINGDDECVYIVEGYATGCSVYSETKCTVVVAFDAGNIPKTLEFVSSNYQNSKIVIASDNDKTGITYAEKAAKKIGCYVSPCPIIDKDWNDLAVAKEDVANLLVENETFIEKEQVSLIEHQPHDVDITFSEDDVRDMLSYIDPDCDNDMWVRLGMSVKSGGFPIHVWEDWSSLGKKYKKGECRVRWNSFSDGAVTIGTLYHEAKVFGWRPKERDTAPIDVSEVDLLAVARNKIVNAQTEKIINSIDFDPKQIDGLVGDTVRWICSDAIFEQPLLALLNTLTFAAAIFGRVYSLRGLKTRPNIYTVGLVPTGRGKDHSRKRITELAHQAGLLRFLGDHSIRSESGVARSLTTKASQLMMLDEFGLLMEALSDDGASHLRNAMKLLIILYSSSNSVYNHGTYADIKNEPMILNYPNLSIYGTSTESTYSLSLKRKSIESGELNRFIVLPNKFNPAPRHDVPDILLPKSLVEDWKYLGDIQPGLAKTNSNTVIPEPTWVGIGQCGEILKNLLEEQCNHDMDKYPELWGRYRENTIKIGMILSIIDNPKAPVLVDKWMVMAEKIVKASIEYMIRLADNNISESQYEKMQFDIARLVSKGGLVKRDDLRRSMRKIELRKFNELLSDMEDQGVISVVRNDESGRGRKGIFYKLNK